MGGWGFAVPFYFVQDCSLVPVVSVIMKGNFDRIKLLPFSTNAMTIFQIAMKSYYKLRQLYTVQSATRFELQIAAGHMFVIDGSKLKLGKIGTRSQFIIFWLSLASTSFTVKFVFSDEHHEYRKSRINAHVS